MPNMWCECGMEAIARCTVCLKTLCRDHIVREGSSLEPDKLKMAAGRLGYMRMDEVDALDKAASIQGYALGITKKVRCHECLLKAASEEARQAKTLLRSSDEYLRALEILVLGYRYHGFAARLDRKRIIEGWFDLASEWRIVTDARVQFEPGQVVDAWSFKLGFGDTGFITTRKEAYRTSTIAKGPAYIKDGSDLRGLLDEMAARFATAKNVPVRRSLPWDFGRPWEDTPGTR